MLCKDNYLKTSLNSLYYSYTSMIIINQLKDNEEIPLELSFFIGILEIF